MSSLLIYQGITHILQVLPGVNPCFPSEFKYKVLNVVDVPWENIQQHFPSCNRFINHALSTGGAVFVHCYAGVSRSAAVVVAYLMHSKKMPMTAALSLVKEQRPVVFPNQGFHVQLLQYESKLFKQRKTNLLEIELKKQLKQDPQFQDLRTYFNKHSKVKSRVEFRPQLKSIDVLPKPEPYISQTSKRPQRNIKFNFSLRTPKANQQLNLNSTKNATISYNNYFSNKDLHKTNLIENRSVRNDSIKQSVRQSQNFKPGLTIQVQDKPKPTVMYKCMECNYHLFDDLETVQHKPKDFEEPCQNIFTSQLDWIKDQKALFGFIQCPKCNSKLGVFAQDGQKCNTCFELVCPSYQFFGTKIVDQKIEQDKQSMAKSLVSIHSGAISKARLKLKLL